MKVRSFHTRIWADSFFLKLSSQEKLLFIYFLFNQRTNIIFLYECPEEVISFETGLSKTIIRKSKEKFEKAKKIFFFKDYIFLFNATKYQQFTGEKNEIAKKKLLQELNPSVLSWYTKIKNTPINTPIDRDIKRVCIPSKTKTKIKIKTKIKKEKFNKKKKEIDEDFIHSLYKKFSGLNVRYELEKWKDWKLAKGRKFKDNRAAFRNWLRKSLEFSNKNTIDDADSDIANDPLTILHRRRQYESPFEKYKK